MPPLVFGRMKMQDVFQMREQEQKFMAYRHYAWPCFMTEFYGQEDIKKICMVFALTGSKRWSKVKLPAV